MLKEAEKKDGRGINGRKRGLSFLTFFSTALL
jgi:hypothetical protein